MKTCPNCFTENSDDSVRCEECGQTISKTPMPGTVQKYEYKFSADSDLSSELKKIEEKLIDLQNDLSSRERACRNCQINIIACLICLGLGIGSGILIWMIGAVIGIVFLILLIVNLRKRGQLTDEMDSIELEIVSIRKKITNLRSQLSI